MKIKAKTWSIQDSNGSNEQVSEYF